MPKDQELSKATALFAKHVEELLNENPEAGDFHPNYALRCFRYLVLAGLV